MKNNRLNQQEVRVIKYSVDRLRELASLESAHFSSNEEENESIKKSIRVYMSWFEYLAQD